MRCICGKKCCGADLIGHSPECFIVYVMYKNNDGQHNRKVIESKSC